MCAALELPNHLGAGTAGIHKTQPQACRCSHPILPPATDLPIIIPTTSTMSTATLPNGKSDARYETSAAVAETEASTTTLSNQVQRNAGQLHTAAVDAAHSAEVRSPLYVRHVGACLTPRPRRAQLEERQRASAVEQLEQGLSHKTDVAAAQGATDVASLKTTASGYVDQAKQFAGSAIAAAQVSILSHPLGSTVPCPTREIELTYRAELHVF